MATAQLQKNTLGTTVFPNKVTTESQSLVLVKRLLAVAVSCITYLRGMFPEKAYGNKYIEDLCVKILKEDKSCPGSTQIVKWMFGCYDALQKKYLRMVALSVSTFLKYITAFFYFSSYSISAIFKIFIQYKNIYMYSIYILFQVYTDPEDPQTVTECYQFKFKYTKDGPVMDFESSNKKTDSKVSCADTRKASVLLVRKLYVLMQNLGPLPSDIFLNMKLFYYDEVTPSDYQPPGFKEGDSDSMMFEGEPVHLTVGEVATPFHSLKVKVTTESDRMEQVDQGLMCTDKTKQSLQLDDTEEGGMQDSSMNIIQESTMKEARAVDDNVNSIEREDSEIVLTCQEAMKTADEGSCLSDSRSQMDQLLSQTSDLTVAGSRRTRSGRGIAPSVVDGGELCRTSPKTGRKRGLAERNKPVSQFEIPCSQEDVPAPKRRKFSEPKERF
ncbi:HORMA domain-containing protein 1 isoform X1 [Acipenser ruthenus]|uniref:HORMA domain-containing protein 1 isoform X1 n=1 Tax=Acipenser ruthenus TaxID=7906 RepID=UPI002741F51B|nr:HORMA domain-containing protein 1 isoform X1 [Acipenser ruthenus]